MYIWKYVEVSEQLRHTRRNAIDNNLPYDKKKKKRKETIRYFLYIYL